MNNTLISANEPTEADYQLANKLYFAMWDAERNTHRLELDGALDVMAPIIAAHRASSDADALSKAARRVMTVVSASNAEEFDALSQLGKQLTALAQREKEVSN